MNKHESLPTKCDVVVLGGGPAGASSAGFLAKQGLDVVLLDKVKHPRPQVGESIIPHAWKLFEALGFADTVRADGFLPKAGGLVVWGDKIQLMKFSEFGYGGRPGLHVERDRLDELLVRHVAKLGTRVFEEVIARGVDFADPLAPVVRCDDRREGGSVAHAITCKYVVDATGPSALLAKQFNCRRLVHEDLKFLGLWGYFTGARYFDVDGKSQPPEMVRDAKPVTFVLSYEDGWAWDIVLRDVTSVGFVVSTGSTKGMNTKELEAYFLQSCRTLPYLRELLANAEFVPGSMAFRPDYSYYSERVVGNGFFCAGDAAAFVDPIFSQGVVTGLYHGSLLGWALKSALDNPARRTFYHEMYANRVLQYYGFSRLLAFGDFGGEGVDPRLVKQFVKGLPANEMELSFAAAWSTCRGENLSRMLAESGIDAGFLQAKVHVLPEIHP